MFVFLFILIIKVCSVDSRVFVRLQTSRYDFDLWDHFYFCTIQASCSAIAAKVWFHFEVESSEVGVRGERQSL